jgi:hypothetical protein
MSRTYRITALVGGSPGPALKAALRSAVGAQRHDGDPDAVSKRDGRLAGRPETRSRRRTRA